MLLSDTWEDHRQYLIYTNITGTYGRGYGQDTMYKCDVDHC